MIVLFSIRPEPVIAFARNLPGCASGNPSGDTVHFSVKPPALHPQAHLAGHPLQSVGHKILLQSCGTKLDSAGLSFRKAERYKARSRRAATGSRRTTC